MTVLPAPFGSVLLSCKFISKAFQCAVLLLSNHDLKRGTSSPTIPLISQSTMSVMYSRTYTPLMYVKIVEWKSPEEQCVEERKTELFHSTSINSVNNYNNNSIKSRVVVIE